MNHKICFRNRFSNLGPFPARTEILLKVFRKTTKFPPCIPIGQKWRAHELFNIAYVRKIVQGSLSEFDQCGPYS